MGRGKHKVTTRGHVTTVEKGGMYFRITKRKGAFCIHTPIPGRVYSSCYKTLGKAVSDAKQTLTRWTKWNAKRGRR